MKRISTLVFFILLCQSCFSQVWNSLGTFGGPARARSGSFSIPSIGTGYVVAGGNSGYLHDVWAYDTLAQTWTSVAPLPDFSENDDEPVCFSINGKGYAATGAGCCPSYSDSVYEYDPVGNTWTTVATFPGPNRGWAVGFVIGDTAYVGGGINDSAGPSNSTGHNDFYAYNATANTWKKIASYPGKGVVWDVGFSINGKGYVGTGALVVNTTGDDFRPEQDFWEYDPGTNAWIPRANYPGGPRAGAVGWATCDKGYIGCGYTDSSMNTLASDFWQYDPTKDAWTQIASYGGIARDWPNGFVIGKSAFVGNGNNNTQLNDFWEYTQSVTPAFTTSNSSSPNVCAGHTVSFTDTSNFTPEYWSWSFPGGTPDTSSSQDPVITYDSAGTYNVMLIAWNGCDSGVIIDSNYITVYPAPSKPVLLPKDTSFCGNFSLTLSSGTTGFNYLWSTGDTTHNLTVTTLGNYWVSVYNNCDTINSDTVNVVVDTNTILNILPPSPFVCSGAGVILSVSGGGSDFVWSPSSGLSSTSGDSVAANPSATITYYVSGTDSIGCPGHGSDVVQIIPAPNKPTITVSATGDSLISSAITDNQWFFDDQLINGATGQIFVITGHAKGYYYVVVTNEANGCSTTSDSTTSINQLSIINDQLSIYPNPFNNNINVKINSSAQNVNEWSLQLTDVLGRTIYSTPSLNYNNEIDLSNLPGGMYFITIINKTARAVLPVVKQN